MRTKEPKAGRKHTNTLYAEFYRPLVERLRLMGVQSPGKGALQGRWRSFRAEYPDVVYATGLDGTPCVFLYLKGADHQQRYRALLLHREAIDTKLKGAIWRKGRNTSWIRLKSDARTSLNDPKEKLEDARQWMADNLIRLRHVLHPYLRLPWR